MPLILMFHIGQQNGNHTLALWLNLGLHVSWGHATLSLASLPHIPKWKP